MTTTIPKDLLSIFSKEKFLRILIENRHQSFDGKIVLSKYIHKW